MHSTLPRGVRTHYFFQRFPPRVLSQSIYCRLVDYDASLLSPVQTLVSSQRLSRVRMKPNRKRKRDCPANPRAKKCRFCADQVSGVSTDGVSHDGALSDGIGAGDFIACHSFLRWTLAAEEATAGCTVGLCQA